MKLNDLLALKGYDPEDVLVFRHRPHEMELFKVLPWIAAERPDLFNAYQQAQSTKKIENALKLKIGKGYLASFIGHHAASAVFIALYRIESSQIITQQEFNLRSDICELENLGQHRWYTDEMAALRPAIEYFNLVETDFYSHWKGKIVVSWPPPERSWYRRAHKNNIGIQAVLEDSFLVKSIPEWRNIVLTWSQLEVMPSAWKEALSQWRGIYYIYDRADGKGYVGSASGQQNLFGRWQQYATTGHGNNKLLRLRKPESFEFSILERVSPDLQISDIVRLENTWKQRLHTLAPCGLNDN